MEDKPRILMEGSYSPTSGVNLPFTITREDTDILVEITDSNKQSKNIDDIEKFLRENTEKLTVNIYNSLGFIITENEYQMFIKSYNTGITTGTYTLSLDDEIKTGVSSPVVLPGTWREKTTGGRHTKYRKHTRRSKNRRCSPNPVKSLHSSRRRKRQTK